jgi:hypothetical protein
MRLCNERRRAITSPTKGNARSIGDSGVNNHSELTEVAVAEHNIKPEIRHTNGGHIEISWQVVPEKELRRQRLAWSHEYPGRGAKAVTRRQPDAQAPEPTEDEEVRCAGAGDQPAAVPVPDQLSALRGEVAHLSMLVLLLGKVIGGLRDTIGANAPTPEPLSSRSV